MRYLIASDLDGTLLDHHDYSWEAAKPALSACEHQGIPVILNTSKTLAEVDVLSAELGLSMPVVVENGSALIFPADWPVDLSLTSHGMTAHEGRWEQLFGAERSQLLAFLVEVRQRQDWRFEGFADWSIGDIVMQTGLDEASASRAARKQFSEPFIWHDSDDALDQFTQLAQQTGFDVLKGGRFFHLQGRTDKAKPLLWLLQHIHRLFPLESEHTPELVCLGDNHNDVAMLNAADWPICVRSPVAPFPVLSTQRPVTQTQAEGPAGWNEAVLDLLTY